MVRAHLHYTWHELMGALVGKIELETRWLYYIYNIIALPAWPCNKESSLLIFRVVLSSFFFQYLVLVVNYCFYSVITHLDVCLVIKYPICNCYFFPHITGFLSFIVWIFFPFSEFWIFVQGIILSYICFMNWKHDLCFDVPIQSTIYTSDI